MARTEEVVPVVRRIQALGLQALGRTPLPIAIAELVHVLEALWRDETSAELAALRVADPSKPYGRRILFADDRIEAMVAAWTRGLPCVPHDHGGSIGAVQVLSGRARHVTWRVIDDALVSVAEDVFVEGDILTCGPDLIHSLGDDGAPDPLVTLHLYTDAIDHMVLYDQAGNRTLVVDGGCGAWIPDDEPGLIRSSVDGIHPIHAVLRAS